MSDKLKSVKQLAKQVLLNKTTLLGLLLSVMTAAGVYSWNMHDTEKVLNEEFMMESQIATDKLNSNIDRYTTLTQSLGAYLSSSNSISYEEYSNYVQSLELQYRNFGFIALGFIKHVDNKNINEQYNTLRALYTNNLKDTPEVLDRVLASIDKNQNELIADKEYFIVHFSEPIKQNYNRIGRNVGNIAVRKEALKNGQKTGEITTSGKLITLYDDKKESHIILNMNVPVYNYSTSVQNINSSEKPDLYIGSATTSIDINRVLKDIVVELNKKNILFQVFTENEASDSSSRELVYDSRYERKTQEEIWPSYILAKEKVAAPLHRETVIKIADKRMRVVYYKKYPPAYVEKMEYIFLISILSGISLFSLWIFIFSLYLSKHRAAVLAEQITSDLRVLAWNDTLTGLLNRGRFLSYIKERIATYPDSKFMLMFIDLDGFKKVNDTLGHEAGDEVLKEYAKRMSNIFNRNTSTLARVGGDEFVLLVDAQTGSPEEIEQWIEKIKIATSDYFEVKSHKFHISQSIGVVVYPDMGEDPEELLRKSDMAMYTAKKEESVLYQVYNNEMSAQLVERTKMESDLVNALKNNEMYIVFQPKMEKVGDKYKICAMEALMRWNSPVWGEVSPTRFVRIAEENGYIYPLTSWLTKTVCERIKEWKEKYNMVLPVSVNLSANQFLNEKLCMQILTDVENSDVDPKQLMFEITESTAMKNPEVANIILKMFSAKGFKFSIDDFGTGYSSLSYLTKLPFHELKVDRSFVVQAMVNESDKSVIAAIIAMAHKIGLKVVAEGVETSEQLEFLQQQHCDEYQGYYFSRPLNESDLLVFMETQVPNKTAETDNKE